MTDNHDKSDSLDAFKTFLALAGLGCKFLYESQQTAAATRY
jgi:hypothetical protein